MRLWTIHPRYLDAKGLVALWREGLLAQAVLQGRTQGYRHHPQLIRFRAHDDPVGAVAAYLHAVLAESRARDYRFDAGKLPPVADPVRAVAETRGQLIHEWHHLLGKLQVRDPARHARWSQVIEPDPHPLFTLVPGGVRHWEKSG